MSDKTKCTTKDLLDHLEERRERIKSNGHLAVGKYPLGLHRGQLKELDHIISILKSEEE